VRDTDLRSYAARCHREPSKKDPEHVACTPETYVSPLAWDGLDNAIFRPFAHVFAVDNPGQAPNANSLDEVPDSAWFTNRLGARAVDLDELSRGACTEKDLLPDDPPDDAWTVDEGKGNGSSPGFRINIPGKGKYLLKADGKPPERSTAATVIGAAAYQAVGYFTSCEQIVHFKPSALKLVPGLVSSDNTGKHSAFDRKALDAVLAQASRTKNGMLRMQASAWLPGHLVGPFRYEGTRSDDANDIIAHQDRRELRGGRVLASWLDHFDAREQNSMDTWIADDTKAPDSSPGYVRHYYLDMSDCLGSEWAWEGISRRLGYSYLLDWGDIGRDFITLGIPRRTWDLDHRTPGREKFGFFNVADFVPDKWKNEYPNPAFSSMRERDGAWMARILARFTPAMVQKLATLGRFSDLGDTGFVADVLEGRLRKILDRYLTRLSPIADVHVEAKNLVCGTDLIALRPQHVLRLEARLENGAPLPLEEGPEGRLCATLPAADAGSYLVVTLRDGVARGPLRAHLRAVEGGYTLAGVERPE